MQQFETYNILLLSLCLLRFSISDLKNLHTGQAENLFLSKGNHSEEAPKVRNEILKIYIQTVLFNQFLDLF